jgi:hypothetical protein
MAFVSVAIEDDHKAKIMHLSKVNVAYMMDAKFSHKGAEA